MTFSVPGEPTVPTSNYSTLVTTPQLKLSSSFPNLLAAIDLEGYADPAAKVGNKLAASWIARLRSLDLAPQAPSHMPA